jgi:hypothetical protein
LQIITQKESDQEEEDSMLELETETNYSEDNTNEVEKEDDYLTAKQQKKMKRSRAMKRPIASRLQDVNGAIERLKKISYNCKTQEDSLIVVGEV